MPSFDIVNQVNLQEVDNAVNNTLKEVASRYDFRGLHTEIGFDRKTKKIHIVAADKMKMTAVREMLVRNFIKRNLNPKAIQFKDPEGTSQGNLKMDAELQEGIPRDTAKKIVKVIKELKMKVQPAIQEDQIRVSSKKIDDLQSVIQHLRGKDLNIPLQFINMK